MSSAIAPAREGEGCILCRVLRSPDDGLVVHRTSLSFVCMNLYPYNSGHVMVLPVRHVGTLQDAQPEELADLMALARRLEGILQEIYRPDGLNMGMNLGRAAGAGVADHLHLHLVPRWVGDTNFMTVFGDTRVHPEDPAKACLRLREHFK